MPNPRSMDALIAKTTKAHRAAVLKDGTDRFDLGTHYIHNLGQGRYIIGPPFHWDKGDRVKLPDGTIVVVGGYSALQPMTMSGLVEEGLRPVEIDAPHHPDGKRTFLADGMREAYGPPAEWIDFARIVRIVRDADEAVLAEQEAAAAEAGIA